VSTRETTEETKITYETRRNVAGYQVSEESFSSKPMGSQIKQPKIVKE
jgi:hypothetical protein